MLNSVIQTSRKVGMQSFNDELTRLAVNRIISPKEAFIRAIDKVDIEHRLHQNNISMHFKEEEQEEARKRQIAAEQEQLDVALRNVASDPKNVDALIKVAWIRATSVVPELRDGKTAVKMASNACDIARNKDPYALTVLGAAFAEIGNFRKAVDATRKAMKLYNELEYHSEAEALQSRVEMFQSKRPYRNG
jgi:tetratricopeptide (TPR) repeat protein